MENGSFQAKLAHLEINDDNEAFTQRPPSDRISSVQSLMQQNEDLASRLKISIQKMARLEDHNDDLAEANRKLRNTIDALNDQILIWKEKEKLWQERFEKSEFKLAEIKSRIPDLGELTSQLNRYQRYHERVKKQIKPYILQLKNYAAELKNHIQSLNTELDRKEFDIQRLTELHQQLQMKFEHTVSAHNKAMEEMKNIHQSEMAVMTKENYSLKEALFVAEKKCEQLDSALNRQDELINQNVILRRQIEDLRSHQTVELEGLRQSLGLARNEILQKDARIEDLQRELESLKAENQSARNDLIDVKDQMLTLRMMWTDKSKEMEKLALANQALEKLNSDLSQKLRDLRQ